MMHHSAPTFYRSIDVAKAFYADVMPFSTEKIIVKDIPTPNNEGKAMIYASPMQDDVLSLIYLFETPDKTFYIGYDEKKKEK